MLKSLGSAASKAVGRKSASSAASHDNGGQSQDSRLQFLLRVGGGMDASPRCSMSEEEIDTITRLHDLATTASRTTAKEAPVEVSDVELINRASALTKKARGMLEMIHAIDQIGMTTSAWVITDFDRAQLERWREAYLPWVKSTTDARTLSKRYCESLTQSGNEEGLAVQSYVGVLSAMAEDGHNKGFGSFIDSVRDRIEPARKDYYNRADGAPAPPTVLWDLHAEHENSIRAHMDGLRRTVVSVLTDLHTLSSKAKLSSQVVEALDAPWRDMEKELKTLKLPYPPLWVAEQARILKVRPELLVPPSGARSDSLLYVQWI